MKNFLKIVASFVMVLAVVFGMNVASAEAYGEIEFVCDASQSNECLEVLPPDSCLIVLDSSNTRDNLLQISNLNPEVDGRFSVDYQNAQRDYDIYADTSLNYYFGKAADHKVCNTSYDTHPLILVKYPSFPAF